MCRHLHARWQLAWRAHLEKHAERQVAFALDWDLHGTTERRNDGTTERRKGGTTETEETQIAAETSGIDADKPEQQAFDGEGTHSEITAAREANSGVLSGFFQKNEISVRCRELSRDSERSASIPVF